MTPLEIKNVSDLQKLADTVKEVANIAKRVEILIKEMTIKIYFK